MHTETERSARADIPTHFWYISNSDNRKTGGVTVPPRPSDDRDVRLLLIVAADAEEPEAIARAIAGKRGLHGHHMAAVVCQAADEDTLQPAFQRQPELLPAAELLVDHGHHAGPERVRPRQGAQPAAGVGDWPLVREDRVPRGGSCGFRRCDAGGVQRDRLAGALGRGRGAATCRTGAGYRARRRHGEQERESSADLLEDTSARLCVHLGPGVHVCFAFDRSLFKW